MATIRAQQTPSDDALVAAIKCALDAGEYSRAARLVAVLTDEND